jgi:hypothetical protein
MYKLYFDAITNQVYDKGVRRLSDNAFIPFDPANTDYVAYLAWVEAGNVPLPPDEQTGQNTPIQE